MPAEVEKEPILQPRVETHIEDLENGKSQADYDTVKGYLHRVETHPGSNPVKDNFSGQQVLHPAPGQVGTITLPLTDDQINQGLKQSPGNSVFWLASWCTRMLKKGVLLGKNIIYPDFRKNKL